MGKRVIAHSVTIANHSCEQGARGRVSFYAVGDDEKDRPE
jgi:hypothetical protein